MILRTWPKIKSICWTELSALLVCPYLYLRRKFRSIVYFEYNLRPELRTSLPYSGLPFNVFVSGISDPTRRLSQNELSKLR